MAKKRRKKPAAKAKKKSAVARKRRKTVKRKAGSRPAKRKGVIASIVGAAEAVADTLADAERLHHKLEPHVPPDPE